MMFTLKGVRLLNSTFKSSAVSKMTTYKVHLSEIFQMGVRAVQPEQLLANKVHVEDNHLLVNDRSYNMGKGCYVVGFGKAVLGMAVELEKILGSALSGGIVTVPQGIFADFETLPHLLPNRNSRIRFIEGAKHNLPDLAAYGGAVKIRNLVTTLDEGNLLIVLISGGGSSLLPLPKQPVSLEEKLALIKSLGKAGATIIELNTVRKKLSELKGGRLAILGKRLQIVSLIISDVVGDPLDFIASGPTVPNTDAADAAMKIVLKYQMLDFCSEPVREVLTSKGESSSENSQFDWVHNVIIGNNRLACEGAAEEARKSGYQTLILTASILTDVKKLSTWYTRLVHLIFDTTGKSLKDFLDASRSEYPDLVQVEDIYALDSTKPMCLIASGEPSVVVKGQGCGGRSQELALRFALDAYRMGIREDVAFLCAGTDGQDGPTDAAGAIGYCGLVQQARMQNLDPTEYLQNSDSYGFYSNFNGGEYLIKTRLTGTNVMDLHVLILKT